MATPLRPPPPDPEAGSKGLDGSDPRSWSAGARRTPVLPGLPREGGRLRPWHDPCYIESDDSKRSPHDVRAGGPARRRLRPLPALRLGDLPASAVRQGDRPPGGGEGRGPVPDQRRDPRL